MITAFEALLKDLGDNLDFDMTPESNGICSIIIDDKLVLQLENSRDEQEILIISPILELPPGSFRTKVFINALKANNQIPKVGCFAFNDASAELFLFEYFPLQAENVEKFRPVLEIFIEKAITWKEALLNNESAPLNFLKQIEQQSVSPLNGPFFR